MLSSRDIEELEIPSPKRTFRRVGGWASFFPYYAGYPDTFADSLIRQTAGKLERTVFDPWNGSGTSTYSAAKLGHRAVGFDINPVMGLVAKARLLPISELPSLTPLVDQLLDHAIGDKSCIVRDDPLLNWFGPITATNFRRLERSIAKHFIPNSSDPSIENISTLAACFYVALFTVAKQAARPLRGSNPTWTSAHNRGVRRLSIRSENLKSAFRQVVCSMEAEMRLVAITTGALWPEIRIRDSAANYGFDFLADIILTSPPYCTRIDYTAATRIELAILQPLFSVGADELSKAMLGTVKVPKVPPARCKKWGETANTFLCAVESHSSKASRTYYLKNHLDYFDKLQRSLELATQRLKPGGLAIMVVQDSFYKNIHNDLPTVVSEMMTELGACEKRRSRFPAKRLMSGVHKYASKYRSTNQATEEVLVFQKEF